MRLVGGEDRDRVLIEDRAIGTDLSKKFVLALAPDNRIEYRLIELGPEINGLRVVKQGLAPGDLIVVNGLQHVRTEVTRSTGAVVPVDYRLRRTADGWKAFDVVIEGISYVQNYRTDLDSEISARGLDATIKRIETQGLASGGERTASR